MRFILPLFCLVMAVSFKSSSQSLWSESADKKETYFSARVGVPKPSAYRVMNVNVLTLKQIQGASPFLQENAQITGAPIQLPLPDGGFHLTTLAETSVWENRANPDPAVKTYSMINPQTKAFEGNILVANNTVRGILFTEKGTVYITPFEMDNSGSHMFHYTQDLPGKNFDCLVNDNHASQLPPANGRTTAGDGKHRVYRLAVAATGEYTNWAGSAANANNVTIPALVSIINAIYKRDLNVTFQLIPTNINVVFTDPATDPYSSSSASSTMLNENNTALNTYIGSGNYDIGIVVTKSSGGGGIAQLSSVCGGSKGRGACGDNVPQGQWFDGAVAHEIGHMFGATHSFVSTNAGNCLNNRTTSSSWEPGSGSTLMAYAGAGCGASNMIQVYQDYYFHAGSIEQMQNFILSGGSCVTGNTTANVAPVATFAGTASNNVTYNIPANTPFVLSMNATDANGDALTYNWDQLNPDFSGSGVNNTIPPQSSNASGPMFRSRPATSNPTRYFPSLQYLPPNVPYSYEVLPSVARTMNFRGTVRDNSSLGGITSEVNVTLNVQGSSGFKVTAPGWGTIWNKNGNNTAPVTWDVVGTNGSPYNTANVDILLSTDNGLTFPITLASNVPNIGSYNVPIPSVNTNSAKVMVKGVGNVFFNVNEDPFIISDPMPVTFLSFNARKDGKTSLLTWSTATEVNSDKFIIERSSNGTDFTTQVGTVKAAGNSTSVKNYTLTDATPMGNWNYYRLKQIDTDGKFTYSKTVSVYFGKGNSTFVSVFPNPVKDNTTVDLYTEKGGMVNMEVYDNKGALVIKRNYSAAAGQNRVALNISALSTGVYTLKCYSNSEVIGITKLIKD